MSDTPIGSTRRISAFSVILIMIVLMVVGAAIVPLLKVQYSPSDRRTGFSVSFGWNGVSARVVESEVTSKLEGVLGSIDGVVGIRAESWKGGGNVSLQFKKGTRMDAARFEAATQIRHIYDKLPRGVSYPYINMSLGGSTAQTIMTYTINAALPPHLIDSWAKENLIPTLSRIEGVENVSLSGATPFQWRITFDPNLTRDAGISTADITRAFNSYFREDNVGSYTEGDMVHTVRLVSGGGTDLENIPVKKVGDRLYFLRDIATVEYEESLPQSYYRINGLNTIYMVFTAGEGINTIGVADEVRRTMTELEATLPPDYTYDLTYDASQDLQQELDTIFLRAALSLLILLGFVWAVSRSLRYLMLIGISIVVNLLVAVIFYYLLGVQIQMYSLAGITVSLGIVMDTSIVMIDHYSYYRDKRVFTSILGALLTTIAALLVIFFLPDEQKANLVDFVWVIVINLSISVVIAFLFIPALLEKIPLRRKGVVNTRLKGKRRISKVAHLYERFILWGRRHRWLFTVLLIFGIGIPVHLLPEKAGEDKNDPRPFPKFYNQTIGGTWYQNNKGIFETVLGGSFRYFSTGYRAEDVFRRPEPRKTIFISAGMPEGCSVHQLNEVIRSMENHLSRYDRIGMYETRVNSFNDASIVVSFDEEVENSAFPVMLWDEIVSQANRFGGANWTVVGVNPREQYFSNRGIGGNRSRNNGIRLKGYNYDMLYRYAERLVDSLRGDRRVQEIGIFADNRFETPENEFFIRYDREKIARAGLDLGRYYDFLQQQLFESNLQSVFDGEKTTGVVLASSEKDAFDLWHIRNDMVEVDTIRTRLNDVGTITMERSGNRIVRNNQEYELVVGFNYVGAWELSNLRIERSIESFNDDVLPMGYKAESARGNYFIPTAKDNWRQAGLLLLVIAIIYSLCAIIFESLGKPFVVLLLIPVGFIGLFLTFAIGKFTFTSGGFAAMVMMCGIVVNAGIYIVNEYNIIREKSAPFVASVSVYVKAFNRKIVPTLLTIVSTVLGLIPFLFDGTDSVFWFAFAVGVMGSMLFSMVALFIYLPIYFPFGERPQKFGEIPQNKSR